MTFFNKKTEVMQIEMTPYGRYLYSIGKFKPHSYEFVDDDVVYKVSGSTEAQEAAHTRITSETPKLKINRAFQDEAPQVLAPSRIQDKRAMVKKNNQRQSDLFAMGKSSYSSDKAPGFQISALRGKIKESTIIENEEKPVFIPQIEMDFVIFADTMDSSVEPLLESEYSSKLFDDGTYIDLSFNNIILDIKEFSSFYEKHNFEIEVFISKSSGQLQKLRHNKREERLVNGMLLENKNYNSSNYEYLESNDMVNYYFDIDVDDEIATEEICEVIDKIEIINPLIDSDIECPDKRTDRFNIYGTRVSPEDLEDCD